MRRRSSSRGPTNPPPAQNAKHITEITTIEKMSENDYLKFSFGFDELNARNEVRSAEQIGGDIRSKVNEVSGSKIVDLRDPELGVNPFVIGMTYLRRLATEQISAKDTDDTKIRIDVCYGKFGSVVFDSNLEKIERKLDALKTQRNHKTLSGILYVKGNYTVLSTSRGKKLSVEKIEDNTGALHIGSEEIPLLVRPAEVQKASSFISLVAHKLVGFSLHSADYTTGRMYAEKFNLYTCLTRHDEVVVTARSFSDLKTITYSILCIPDVVAGSRKPGYNVLPSLPKVIVCLGFNESSYEFDNVLFELGKQLEGHTVTFTFKSKEIEVAEAVRIMKTTQTWEKKMRDCKFEDEIEIKPFAKNQSLDWHYALTSLDADSGRGEKDTEYANQNSLHSLTIPIPKLPGKCIQVTSHASNAGHLFEFCEAVEGIVQTFVKPPNP